jgi:hypothetical protein
MVGDVVEDGKRIAQLLSSELTGLQRGPLSEVSVVDADTDAEPSPDGTVAYGVAYEGDRVGQVRMFPTSVTLDLSLDDERIVRHAADAGLDGERSDDGIRVHVETGASVKRAVDVLRMTLS